MQDSSEFDFKAFPFAKEVSTCGYLPEKQCTQFFSISTWFKAPEFSTPEKPFPIMEYYGFLKRNGFCRYHSLFYRYECKGCARCTPIRVPVEQFRPSKNQKINWNKNQDIQVTLVKDPGLFVSEERAFLFREYDAYHNSTQEGFHKKSIEEAMENLREMNSGYDGIWNLEYRLNGRLIGVSILDITEDSDKKIDSICSNYFYYEISDEIEKRSVGTFSVLKELELCKNLQVPYYYLGLFLADCRKMNYKTNFEPYELFIDYTWVNSDVKFPEPGELVPDYPDICFLSKNIEIPILLSAYKRGIFPWFNEATEPVVWYSTDPRFVIPMEEIHIPKTIRKFLKNSPYKYTMDKCFNRVMQECRTMERKDQQGTWIGNMMIKAYTQLHDMGYAHSFEVWHGDELVGGFYGVLLGSIFCGESMFTKESSSSSSAFVLFAQRFAECGGRIIDCQAYTDNMARYGAREIPRSEYLKLLNRFQKVRLIGDLKEKYNEDDL